MSKIIIEDPVIHKLIFELRYNYGFTYLDRCGATLNDLLSSNPGWFSDQINPQSGIIHYPEKRLIYTFNTQRISFHQEQSERIATLIPIKNFGNYANSLTGIVIDRLGIEDFSRIGFRVWRLFGTESFEKAREKIIQLGYVNTKIIKEKIGNNEIEEIGFNFIINTDIGKARIAITPIEQNIKIDPATIKHSKQKIHKLPPENRKSALLNKIKLQKAIKNYPLFSILIDIDFFCEDPPIPEDLSITDFIINAFNKSEKISKLLIEGV